MKLDIYDLFSEYEGSLPDIEEPPCDTDRIKQLVSEGISGRRIRHRRKSKVFIISAAAAVTALTGMTAAAHTDGFSRFVNVLHKSTSEQSVSDELPLVNSSDISGMENNITDEKIVFSGSETADISTVGMYYDNNTLMLSVEIKLDDDINIPSDAVIVPYFSKYKNGIETELYNCSGIGSAAPLIRDDKAGVYYSTFYITENDLAGSTVGIRLENIMSTRNSAEIHEELIAEQAKWKEEFDTESHTVEEWKRYWKENNFDQRTRDFIEERLSKAEPVLEGEWLADIDIPDDIAEIRNFEGFGFKVTADTLSLTLDIERELPAGSTAIPVVTLKNGTAVFDGGTNETEWLFKNKLAAADNCEYYAYGAGNTFCYKEPHPVEDIARIEVIVFNYGENGLGAEEYTVWEGSE